VVAPAGRAPDPVVQNEPVTLPQRITVVTLGARSVANLRAFYAALGWVENEGSTDGYASFDAGGVRLALYPLELLRDEAAPASIPHRAGSWNGTTLAVNVDDRESVDRAYAHAIGRGALPVAEPVDRHWGGYSGYFSDPEGNRWEVAWLPSADGEG
jgi:uncharacterized protein